RHVAHRHTHRSGPPPCRATALGSPRESASSRIGVYFQIIRRRPDSTSWPAGPLTGGNGGRSTVRQPPTGGLRFPRTKAQGARDSFWTGDHRRPLVFVRLLL